MLLEKDLVIKRSGRIQWIIWHVKSNHIQAGVNHGSYNLACQYPQTNSLHHPPYILGIFWFNKVLFFEDLMFSCIDNKQGNCQIWHQLHIFDGKLRHQPCLWQPKQANHNLFLIIRVLCNTSVILQKHTLPVFILVILRHRFIMLVHSDCFVNK